MTQVVVIADDLTGAADAGVMFCPYFRPVLLVADPPMVSQQTSELSPAVLVTQTDSRALAPETARQRLQTLLTSLRKQQPKRLFKKIDSSLRGNIGCEADAVIEGTNAACSFICAAFPALGRTTNEGIHTIHGVPVAKTELCRDPATPVTESHIATLIATQSRHPVHHIGLELVDGRLSRLLEEVARLREQGYVHLTFDATNDHHLERIVALSIAHREKILLVGSAGLAKAAAGQWSSGQCLEQKCVVATSPGQMLYVCGTAAAQTAKQIVALRKFSQCTVIELEPGLLAEPGRRQELSSYAQSLRTLQAEGSIVLKVASDSPAELSVQLRWPAAQVARGLGLATAKLLQGMRPGALFCCGGDTASSVITEVGAWGSELCREIVPGMVLGVLRGGTLDGVPFITKPGSFGREDDLVKLHRYLITNH